MPSTAVQLTVYRGPAGDHSDRAMAAVSTLGAALAARLGVGATTVGEPVPAADADWATELRLATPTLRAMAARVDDVLRAGAVPVSAITRCAVALATQPVVLRHRPDPVVVWLDAHGDLHVPATSPTAFLGGMALSGPLGRWDTGLGAGLPAAQAVLVGARDLDPAEQAHLDAGTVTAVPVGPELGPRLAAALAGRPAYLHVDCDVLGPGVVRADYSVPGGLTLADLTTCAAVLAQGEVIGVEVGEYEGDAGSTATDLVGALEPLWGCCGGLSAISPVIISWVSGQWLARRARRLSGTTD